MEKEPLQIKMKICMVGDGAVGKTSLIRRYVFDEFSDRYLQTMGTKVTKREIDMKHPDTKEDLHIDLTIWDIIGQKGFRKLLQEAYFQGAKGVLGVCDLTRENTLQGLNEWIGSVREVAGDIPVLVIGNKTDLRDDIQIEEAELAKLGDGHGTSYLLTSAKTGENVEIAFVKVVERILKTHPLEKLGAGVLSGPLPTAASP
ncbi:MAG: GTP-binding protein [Methanobacteriota archaeon]|nr:MAG: GTP-binding protein [Euryarchaeota archaeon]